MKYKNMTNEKRKRLEQDVFEKAVKELKKKEIGKELYEFDITIQKIKCISYLSKNELKKSVHMVIDILEELKKLNNSGMDKSQLEKIEKKVESIQDYVMQTFQIWNKISTENLEKLIEQTLEIRNVNFTTAIIFDRPKMISAIISVFFMQVDKFDDEELYELSVWFLLRTFMCLGGYEYN
mgnify:CR=1 FL=1